MSASRARKDSVNVFDLRSQDRGSDPFSSAYAADAAAGPAAAIVSPPPQALIDNVPGDTSTTATLVVDAARIVSAIDAIGDQDFYRIELVAGHLYQIGMYGYMPTAVGDPIGPNGLPLLDAYLELYDGAGNLITAADGGSDTVLNSANSGFDALLTFTATATGIYYVNARAFDNVPADGTDGDLAGDYGLYAEDVTGDPSLYTPYYSPNSPLYAIDWGTQVNKVNQTYRNPDGDEGTRDTGNAASSVDPGALLGHPGKNVISIYFAQAGDVFVSNDLTNPGLPPATITATGVQAFEHSAVMTALHEFEKVADVVYVEVSDRTQADFVYTSYIGTPGPGVSLLGSMSPPGESDEGLAQFNSGDERWNATNLAQGGFSFVTLIHEFGHGHGLAHPHDNGGHSGIMNGVESDGVVADYTTGDFDLNQGVFTMMSYEDGWQTSPYGNAETDVGYGYLGGLMAFDIAAIQDKYGVNEEWAAGDDLYVLKDVNATGTYYSSIWDGGGNDGILYHGTRDTVIDLRPATLQYEYGGGGRMSYAYGIFGGFTIAHGVTIERAISGSGHDTLIGNAVDNVLIAGAGNDWLDGGLGRDVLAGQDGDDTLIGGAGVANEMAGGTGNDTYYTSVAGDTLIELAGEGRDTIRMGLSTYTLKDNFEDLIFEGEGNFTGTGNGLDNLIIGSAAGRSTLMGLDGADTLLGGAGDDSLFGGAGANSLYGGAGNDTYYVINAGDTIVELAGGGGDTIVTTLNTYFLRGEVENILFIGSGDFVAAGSAKANWMEGAGGNDLLNGGLGADILVGNGGADMFLFDSALDGGNIDTIMDFVSGSDRLFLEDSVFSSLGTGALSAGAFATGTAAQDADDRIVYDSASGNLYYDADGSGAGAATLFATLQGHPALIASDILVI